MEKEFELTTVEEIQGMIYSIRGKQVMLDSDVANLYNYATKDINKTVKRNLKRFPEDFCFQLTEDELKNLRFQIGTSSLKNENYGGRRYLPYVFTEQGVAMLSGLLRNDTAVQVSINIINAFVIMRHFLKENGQIFERLTSVEYKLLEHDEKFDLIFDKLQEKKIESQRIFFDGQIYDAYNLIIEIIKKAENKISIIDNYIDDSILEMLSKKKDNVEVVILTSNKSNIKNIDIQKFNKQYPTLKVAKTDKFHDRFIILDEKEMYHLGASIKDPGKKCFGINKIESGNIIEILLKEI